MKLSIIIPVYNEENTILKVSEKVKSLPLEKEIIIVDDGSTDRTREVLEKIKNIQNLKVIFKNKNQGKGSAIREGLKYASGEAIIIQDADLEYEPTDIVHIFKLWIEGYPVVYGSRFLSKNRMPLHSLIANKFLTVLTNILFFSHLTDMETCYKLCPRELLLSLNLQSKGFEIEPEITCKILKRGIKIKEVPIIYNPRQSGKKINWKDGVKAIFYISKYRFMK